MRGFSFKISALAGLAAGAAAGVVQSVFSYLGTAAQFGPVAQLAPILSTVFTAWLVGGSLVALVLGYIYRETLWQVSVWSIFLIVFGFWVALNFLPLFTVSFAALFFGAIDIQTLAIQQVNLIGPAIAAAIFALVFAKTFRLLAK